MADAYHVENDSEYDATLDNSDIAQLFEQEDSHANPSQEQVSKRQKTADGLGKARAKRGQSPEYAKNRMYYEKRKKKKEQARVQANEQLLVDKLSTFDTFDMDIVDQNEELLRKLSAQLFDAHAQSLQANHIFQSMSTQVANCRKNAVRQAEESKSAMRELELEHEVLQQKLQVAHEQLNRATDDLDEKNRELTSLKSKCDDFQAKGHELTKRSDELDTKLRIGECNKTLLETMPLRKLEELRKTLLQRMILCDAVIGSEREKRQRCQVCFSSVNDSDEHDLHVIQQCGHLICLQCSKSVKKCGVCKNNITQALLAPIREME